MPRLALLLAAALAVTACAAQSINLLAEPGAWLPGTDGGNSRLTVLPGTPETPLVVRVEAGGGSEDYPKLTLTWPTPQDWSPYGRFRFRARVTCDAKEIWSKPITIVLYDEGLRRTDLPERPMTQQCIGLGGRPGEWLDQRGWLLSVQRRQVAMCQLYLYELPPSGPHTYTWEIAEFSIEGMGERGTFFDTEVYGQQSLQAQPDSPVGQVGTDDGLQLQLGAHGAITEVHVAGRRVGGQRTRASGLLLRDVNEGGPPEPAGGTITRRGEALVQKAELASGLGLEATYRSAGPYLEVAGKVMDRTGRDRAVTVYLAVPVRQGPWQWWDSPAVSRTEADETGELYAVESGVEYGLNGVHSKYPLGALSLPDQAGLTLGVRMDEPVVHRIGYNPGMGLMYLALDFGLVADKTIRGRSLAEAPFRILLYRHDPAWGMRSALERYYGFFPGFFTQRLPAQRQGGWFVWGKMQDTPGALEAGFRFHWGPAGAEAVKWDNANGPLALQYIEPELYQQTMGDYDRAPTLQEALDRSRKIAAGDEAELDRFMKLGYSHYLPGLWEKTHSHRESCVAVNRACAASVCYDAQQEPVGSAGQFPWMTESRWGVIFPCNLDPDIPDGKGHFCKNLYLESGLREMAAAGCHFDGIALDSFGGYAMFSRANFRRDHFRYSDRPLSFSASPEHLPVVPCFFSSVEFARDLAAAMHGRRLVLMANCSWGNTPAWLTFVAPYLDVFGAEAPRFVDPEFIRAIAYRKSCTDLPYEPRPDWEVAHNQLWGIYPGHGNKVEVMARTAETFRQLAAAGWEPITHAHVAPTTVRLERYGSYLVLHNPAEAAVEATVTPDAQALGLRGAGASFPVSLPAQGTVVVTLR
jgi:hypothetical protein